MSVSLVASAPSAVADGIDVEYVLGDRVARGSLGSAWSVRFDLDCAPVRRFPSFRGQRNYPGLWWFATTSRHVGFESWLERDHLMALDADPDVAGVAEQPFRLHWADGRRHVPDFYVRRRDGGALVIDVRPDSRISDADVELFSRTAAACEAVGWEYRRVGEMAPVRLANLRWLAGYRHPRVYRSATAMALVAAFSEPTALMRGARSVGDPIVVLPVLFHLVWRQLVLPYDGDALITPETVLVASAAGGGL